METARQPPHWENIARLWSQIGSPLRPAPEDVAHFAALLDLPNPAARHALILGVTPELYHLPWAAGSTIRSVDRSAEMIRAIWPGPPASALQADWRDLPFPEDSFDCVLGDGSLTLMNYPQAQRALAATVRQVLKRGGRFVLRLFALPERPETAAAVFADLRAGRIPNVHILKLRLAMALQESAASGIVVHRVYDAILLEYGSLQGLHESTGWPQPQVSTLSPYHRSTDCYHFATCAQSIDLLCASGGLTFERRLENDYPLGERCPLISFRKEDLS